MGRSCLFARLVGDCLLICAVCRAFVALSLVKLCPASEADTYFLSPAFIDEAVKSVMVTLMWIAIVALPARQCALATCGAYWDQGQHGRSVFVSWVRSVI